MTTKETIIQILNAFENDSASPKTEYDKVYLYHDGPGNVKQVTLARGYTECGGALWSVFSEYEKLGGSKAKELLSYKKDSCKGTLPNNKSFLNLITDTAKTDDKFCCAQDIVYDRMYWNPGYAWFEKNGFKLPLSLGVIQDSYLQSGGILDFLRKRFTESVPASGGDEKAWIKSYLETRKSWLANHTNTILHNTVYRPEFFLHQIRDNNWNLDKFPIYPNDSRVG